MSESFLDGKVILLRGDCLELLPTLAENSIDSCVTDPPYHLTEMTKRYSKPDCKPCGAGKDGSFRRLTKGFMGKAWDGGDIAFRPELWAEVWRVLKPGAHLLAFSGTRTYHRMACAIEDAGFEIRDQIGWCYGSGFPKSHDISKAIDRLNGKERTVKTGVKPGHEKFVGRNTHPLNGGWDRPWASDAASVDRYHSTYAPATLEAERWSGWGTALKPSWESLCLAQKPYDLEAICGILARTLMEAICQLALSAKVAGPSSSSSRNGSGAAGFGSAQWNAVAACNTPDDLFAVMDTLPSGSAPPLSLNTALSWLLILDAALRHGSTFTTETRSSLTTDLKTLNSLLSPNTPATTDLLKTLQSGTELNASLVARIFSAVADRLRLTLELSALGLATSKDALSDIRPNWNSIVLARKPLSESSIAANVLRHGTGAINVDGCRIATDELTPRNNNNTATIYEKGFEGSPKTINPSPLGRWPANLIHDGSEEVVRGFPESGGNELRTAKLTGSKPCDDARGWNSHSMQRGNQSAPEAYGDGKGSAARFFYTAKADAEDRLGSRHPTVKPLDLIQYLSRLITPCGGLVLDPFAGTGTLGEAAWREGFQAILIEREEEYQADIVKRMGLCLAGPDERRAASVKQLPPDDLPMFGGGI